MPIRPLKLNADPETGTLDKSDVSTLNGWADSVSSNVAQVNSVANSALNKASSATVDIASIQANGAVPPAAPYPTSCSASESGYIIDGTLYSEVTVSYTAPYPLSGFTGIYLVLQGYRGSSELVKVAEDTFQGAGGTSHSFKVTLQRTGETVTLYFVPKNSAGIAPDDWTTSPYTTVVLDGNASAPNPPGSPTAIAQPLGILLTWSENTERNMKSYNVYRNTVGTFSGSTNIATVASSGSGQASYFDKSTLLGTYYYYWITAVNTALQESSASAGVSNNPNYVSLDSHVVDGYYVRSPALQGGGMLVLDNPDFENSTNLPPEGWYVNAAAPTYVTSGQFRGTRSIRVVGGVQWCGLMSKWYSVTPGDTFVLRAALRSIMGNNIGVQFSFYDSGSGYKGAAGVYTNSTTWVELSNSAVVPSDALRARVDLFVSDVGGGQGDFDCIRVIRCFDPSSVEILSKGAIPNSNYPGMDYTSSTNSVAWSWTQTIIRNDGTTFSNNGSQTVTGLWPSTHYSFFPYYDENTQSTSMVTTGGTGSPAWAHDDADIASNLRARIAEQGRRDHIALSAAAVTLTTPTSGTGTGSGGGDGGCLRKGMFVREQTRGVIRAELLQVGDYIQGMDGTWLRVNAVEVRPHDSWIKLKFNCGQTLMVTAGHPFTLRDGTTKRAHDLCMMDEIPCTTGITSPISMELVMEIADKVAISCDSPHTFFVAEDPDLPWVLTHNRPQMTV